MRRITLAEVDELRRTPGASLALFITDRCPVGCGHCSVSSTMDGPTVTDWDLFVEVVAGIAAMPRLEVVAITGGEPFAERRGLVHAVTELTAAGKAVVLFTSGHWARPSVAAWIRPVLALTSTVYLSTDSFHAAGLASRQGSGSLRARAGSDPSVSPQSGQRQRIPAAVEAITEAGCHLVLQVLDEPGAAETARALSATADISVIKPLRVGRAAHLLAPAALRPATEFGPCGLLNSPTVRYDGRVSACCNEAVITGNGPAGLRRAVRPGGSVADALEQFGADPVLRLIGRYGPRGLQPIVDGPFRTVCQACWAGHDRIADDPKALAAATVLCGTIGGGR